MECPHDHEAINMSTRVLRVGFDKGVGGGVCSFLCSVPIIGALRFSGQLGENWKELERIGAMDLSLFLL